MFPGCHNTHYVDAHHIHHWANGGETSLDNTTLLCTHHHKLLHEGGVTIHRDESDGIYFRRPDGRVIPRAGYRADDMVDDGIGADGAELDRVSAETRMSAIVRGVAPDELGDGDVPAGTWRHGSGAEDPSAVREERGVYRARRMAACHANSARRNPAIDAPARVDFAEGDVAARVGRNAVDAANAPRDCSRP